MNDIETVHSFKVEDAKKYGVDKAVLLYNIKFWLLRNKANKTNFHAGYYWTYNSAEAFSELFPYLSKKKIHRLLVELEECGELISGRFSENKLDRTKWYTTPSFSVPCDVNSHFSNLRHGSSESETCQVSKMELVHTDINTDINNNPPVIPPRGEGTKNKKFFAEKIELPESVDPAAWIEWVKYRREIGKPIKSIATASKQIKLLDQQSKLGIRTQAIVDQSIANGWQGLFSLKNNAQQMRKAEEEISRTRWNSEEAWATENFPMFNDDQQ